VSSVPTDVFFDGRRIDFIVVASRSRNRTATTLKQIATVITMTNRAIYIRWPPSN
jgi:hypothetical protein